MIKIAIDRGGTFTDLYAIIDDKTIITKKVLSVSKKYEDANSYAIELLLRELGRDYEDIEWVRLGTTVATNALLERKGADVSFIVTKGFKDILEIRYQNRPDLFALNIEKPEPLYKEVIEVDERVIVDGDGFVVEKRLETMPKPAYKSVAVMLLHSYGFKDHEKRLKEGLQGYDVVLSSEISPLIKAIDRADTVVVDAYLTPVVWEYRKKIESNIQAKIYFIKSDGGLCEAGEFRGINSILSGPAGGVVALRGIYKDKPLIGFDMGGTSTDVSRYDGELELSYSQEIAGCIVNAPSVDIHTVAAGGGSRLFYKNEMFVVGPESSGSHPGPLCYGKGGYLSLTDANVATGRLRPEFLPKIFGKSGKEALDVEGSRRGFEKLAKKLGKSIEEVAEAFIDVANDNMANAIKEITVKKGFDPKDHVLCVFGGAGGQHAVGVARKLGIKEIFIHRYSGILSAVGIAYAAQSGELVKSVIGSVEETFKELLTQVPQGFEVTKSLFVRFKGTNTSLEVGEENYEEVFKKRFQKRFGFLPEGEVEVEKVKVSYYKTPSLPPREKIATGVMEPIDEVEVFIGGRYQRVKVYTELFAGNSIAGPALIATEHSTIVLDEASKATIDEYGDMRIHLEMIEQQALIEAAKVTLMANRLTFIAKKMGDILQKSARSVNIKERADFSCAIFDPKGNLIVNAPHIPVHLGSMSSVVKVIIAKGYKDATYITNAPYEGGSHLPDITVVTPYIEKGKTLFWVASRGHHADIGGSVPGSMPPFSKWLYEEGAVIESFPIVENGLFKESVIRSILESAGARNVEDNIADIKAQIAANMAAIAELKQIERSELEWFFGRIRSISRQKVRKFLDRFGEVEAEEFLDSGAKISLRVYKKDGKSVFDFSGSSPQLLGNQNTPLSVVRSCVLYALRVMLKEDIPLNEGLLEAIEIRVSQNSLLSPAKEVAVVGGNVTTSQRIVDVIFKAFGIAAASSGCMNNVIFGNENFGYYETIGGGVGATPNADGASGVHTHMTNTKITDVEVMERRYPVVIEEFGLRSGSGGKGKHRGGDGLVRIYRFKEAVDVSLLTERRSFAPYGLAGGKEGAKGENLLRRGDEMFNLGGKVSFKAKPGDRLIVKTPGGGGWGHSS